MPGGDGSHRLDNRARLGSSLGGSLDLGAEFVLARLPARLFALPLDAPLEFFPRPGLFVMLLFTVEILLVKVARSRRNRCRRKLSVVLARVEVLQNVFEVFDAFLAEFLANSLWFPIQLQAYGRGGRRRRGRRRSRGWPVSNVYLHVAMKGVIIGMRLPRVAAIFAVPARKAQCIGTSFFQCGIGGVNI